MASIEMVSSIGVIFSPIIMGSILTLCVYLPSRTLFGDLHPVNRTFATAPQTIFYVHAVRAFDNHINVSLI